MHLTQLDFYKAAAFIRLFIVCFYQSTRAAACLCLTVQHIALMATLTSMMLPSSLSDASMFQSQHFRSSVIDCSSMCAVPTPSRGSFERPVHRGTPRAALFSPATVSHCAQLAERSGISATPGTVNLFAVSCDASCCHARPHWLLCI